MKRLLIPCAVALAIVVLAAVLLPGYLDNAAYRSAFRKESAAVRTQEYSVAAYAYHGYLKRFPKGRHAGEAHSKVVKYEIWNVVHGGKDATGKEKKRLWDELGGDPKNVDLLLELAFLSWAVDGLDHKSWSRSVALADKVLALEPANPIAKRIKSNNEQYKISMNLNMVPIPTSEHGGADTIVFNDPYWMDVYGVGFFRHFSATSRSAPWTVRYRPDGFVGSVTDPDGKVVYRQRSVPGIGEVGLDAEGKEWVYTESAFVASEQITRDRMKILGITKR